jgi:hypothetical protein
MTRRGDQASLDDRGAFLADFGRTERAAPGFRLFTDRLEVAATGGRRARVLPLARIDQAHVVDDHGSVVLRIDGPDLRLDVQMASAWEASLASELIAGLREISDVQGRAATQAAPARPRATRRRRRPAARRTATRTRPSGPPLILALEMEG